MYETDLLDDDAAEVLPADDVPVPVGRPAHRSLVRRDAAATRWRATCACTATTSSSRSASTPSGCRPRTPRSTTASTRSTGRWRTSSACAASCSTMGAMFDWTREVITCRPEYYKWNQWFFLQFWRRGLAYRAMSRGRLVPQRRDAGARAGRGRRPRLRALRHARRSSATWSSGSSASRPTPTSCCTSTASTGPSRQDDADELDRPQRGRRDRRSRSRPTSTSPAASDCASSPPAPTRCSA